MASPPPQANPQWDGRNQGFLSPSQLRQQLSSNDINNGYSGSLGQQNTNSPSMASAADQSQSQQSSSPSLQPRPRQNSLTGTGHTRGPSFFSAFRKNQNTNASAGGGKPGGPGSGGAGGTVNEFGGQQDANHNAQQTAPPPPAEKPRPSSDQQQQRPSIHPEIRSVVQLTLAHARKVYFSGPLVRRVERQPDGARPHKDDGWIDVWAQLGGTTLSIWDMKSIAEASKEGKEVPPTYINIQDAFVQVLGSVTVPATASAPSKRFTDVMTLNTAGSNLLLFACPSTAMLMSWAAALRLSAWEKSRLEEIYTAHLLRITIPDVKESPSPLVKGRFEGWAQVRLAGQTDWKRYYMVVSSSGSQMPELSRANSMSHGRSASPASVRNPRRLSTLFTNRDFNSTPAGGGGSNGSQGPQAAQLFLYMGNKPKERKVPVLAMKEITQVFAMYPERPEMMSISTLMKVEGLLGDEAVAGGMRNREAWMMVMPATETGSTPAVGMLKWIMAFHDAFELYGRPKSYTWDPRDPRSLMFGYPVGPYKDLLFLDREAAETMDPRDDRTSAVRNRLLNILLEKMRAVPPSLPPIPTSPQEQQQRPQQQNGQADGSAPLLPTFNFDSSAAGSDPSNRGKGALTPITERTLESVDFRNSRSLPSEKYSPQGSKSMSGDQHPANKVLHGAPSTVPEETSSENPSILGAPISRSPQPASPDAGSASTGPGSTFVNTGVPKETKSWVGNPTSPDLPPLPTEARPQNRPTTPVTSPKVSPDHPQPTKASPIQRPMSPPRGMQPVVEPPPPQSALTNPHSPGSRQSGYSQGSPSDSASSPVQFPVSPGNTESPMSPKSQYSVLTNPHSAMDPPKRPQKDLPSISSNILDAQTRTRNTGPFPVTPSSAMSPSPDGFDEAGALYYMQQFEDANQNRRIPSTIAETTDESPSEDTSRERSPALKARTTQHALMHRGTVGSEMTSASVASSGLDPTLISHGMANKQSGTRVQITTDQNRDGDEQSFSTGHRLTAMSSPQRAAPTNGDDNSDALAALSYLDQEPSPIRPLAAPQPIVPPPPKLRTPSPPVDSTTPLRSSFAPSKQAAERKARVQAQEAASHAAAHKPGRANGKQKSTTGDRGGWTQSSEEEEEEEEEEEDDDDADSDAPRPRVPRAPAPPPIAPPTQPLHLRGRDMSPHGPSGSMNDVNAVRQSRTLPPVPGTRPGGSEFLHSNAPSRRTQSDQYSESHPRSYYDQGPQIRQQSEAPLPGAAQQNVWSQVLQPGQNPAELNNSNRDTFVQIEPPSQTMTKAFTPQGLLSAGIQDKEDRSAKKQEEIARESGASLINVPNKPPPPQTGLLGAITAHERERKREGGVGAALTEREREKRMAEERQRKLDEFQRQQLEMVQSGAGGSMYQQPQFTGYNPMMANPMMMGMNPMMTGMMGYPGMMPGFGNAQHMFAAQQAAAQAYQQAMMTFSQAGSQAAGGGVGEAAGPPPINPMMSGGGMSMFDPRMSMMGMPMMGSPYAMGGQPAMSGMQGMQGMQGGFPGMPGAMGGPMQGLNPVGMQNTGGSAFDARISPTGNGGNGLKAPSPFQGQAAQGPSSRNSSPAGRGSPATYSIDHSGLHQSSGQSSPRPPQ